MFSWGVISMGMSFFGSVLLSVVTVMHLYVFWRAASLPLFKQLVPRVALVAVGLLLWVLFVLGRTVGHGGTGRLALVLEIIGMHWMVMVFLIAMALAVVEFVTVIGFLGPPPVYRLRGAALIIGGLLSAAALVQGLRPPVVEDYEVRMPGLPQQMDGTVLVAISDLHIGSMIGKDWLADRVAQIRDMNPDIVVLLGDMFEGHGESFAGIAQALRDLSPPLGVWAVLGNHESHRSSSGVTDLLDKAGIHLLRNQWMELGPGLTIAGVEDLTSAYWRRKSETALISKALENHPPGAVVFLSHSPLEPQTAAAAGANLMLSGHTHGGQVWPFGYLVRQRYPFFEGRYDVDGMTLIVSRGAGTWGPRIRLWEPGEILRITLRCGNVVSSK